LEVSDWLHAPAALLPIKELPVSIGYESGWTPELRAGVDDVERRKYFLYRVSNCDPSTVQFIANCYTDCTIPPPLKFRLYVKT
jgi:hypothetical protein